MDIKTLEKLQYRELIEKVKSYCISGLGKGLIDKLEISSDLLEVQNRLNETSEGKRLIEAFRKVPLEGIYNVEPILDKIQGETVLRPEELVIISDFLRGCRKIKEFMVEKEEYAPTLSRYSDFITGLRYIEEEIASCIRIDKVDSSASKSLAKIRRGVEVTESKIGDRVNKFLRSESNKKYIQEFFVSKRDGRYTIPIKMAYKNYVKGSIVETSSKGATVFIEPESVEKLSIELMILKGEEEVEVYRILSTLTGLLSQKYRELNKNQEIISIYDMVFAKAKYSIDIKGVSPRINNKGYINIVGGKHPLLEGEIVPLNLTIGKRYSSLIITGPNAGGKTIVLKTVGLLTLAVQTGLHIAGKERCEIALFDKIFVDIGDNQSMENSLSTFSSHMKNLAYILGEADERTLLLFDEIGSGTEPSVGAALGIAILEEFYKKGCKTVATTHYGEIKNFSEGHSGFENAAMQFKSETLEPLYKLVIGESGESNAMWIARKMGISEEVLRRARCISDEGISGESFSSI